MIKAIIFDFDGLIVDTETLWYECFKKVFEDLGHAFPLDLFEQSIGTEFKLNDYIRKYIKIPNSVEVVGDRAKQLFDQEIDNLRARDGVRSYLEQARSLGLRIGLASSSELSWVEGFLKRLGLREFFEEIRTREDVKMVKPDPELYVKITEALNVEPQYALAFEDSPNGLNAAKAAGLNCVIVPNTVTKKLDFKNHDGRIVSMAERPLTEIVNTFC